MCSSVNSKMYPLIHHRGATCIVAHVSTRSILTASKGSSIRVVRILNLRYTPLSALPPRSWR
jgi:hypothetical protein